MKNIRQSTLPAGSAARPLPISAPAAPGEDPLDVYVNKVNSLRSKLAPIAANQRASADSLGRAAAALRSMAGSRRAG